MDKCLIITWIIEIFFAKNENKKDLKFIHCLKACYEDHNIKNYLIAYIMHYSLNLFDKNKIILKLEEQEEDFKGAPLNREKSKNVYLL